MKLETFIRHPVGLRLFTLVFGVGTITTHQYHRCLFYTVLDHNGWWHGSSWALQFLDKKIIPSVSCPLLSHDFCNMTLISRINVFCYVAAYPKLLSIISWSERAYSGAFINVNCPEFKVMSVPFPAEIVLDQCYWIFSIAIDKLMQLGTFQISNECQTKPGH